MGEVQATLFRLDCNKSVRIETRPERLTSDAGAVLIRELSDPLGVVRLVRRHLRNPRVPSRARHPFAELVRSRIVGWEDQNDVSFEGRPRIPPRGPVNKAG